MEPMPHLGQRQAAAAMMLAPATAQRPWRHDPFFHGSVSLWLRSGVYLRGVSRSCHHVLPSPQDVLPADACVHSHVYLSKSLELC